MAATLASSSSAPDMVLHRLILRLPTAPLFHSALKSQTFKCFPALKTTTSTLSFNFSPFSTRRLFSSAAPPHCLPQQLADDVALIEDVPVELERETETETNAIADATTEGLTNSNLSVAKPPPPPSLTVKEKKELASFAHSLGKKLKSQQVGKSGVTDTVVMALNETLEANELLKLKVRNTCAGEMEDVVKQLEEYTGSVVVGQIGRTVILYRPSVTKLKAEEKRKQAQRVHLRRQSIYKQSSQSRRPGSASGQEPREYARGGRRGSSRY